MNDEADFIASLCQDLLIVVVLGCLYLAVFG